MPIQLEKIFLGNTPSEQRKFITALFRYLKDDYPRLVIPACGQLTLVKCAIEAGYQRENIIASDISIFSHVLGFLYSEQPLSDIGFQVRGSYAEEYAQYKDDLSRAAFLLWLMKTMQLKPEIYYERTMLNELHIDKENQIQLLRERLKKFQDYYRGIQYKPADLRAELDNPEYTEHTLMVINPPAFAGGYQRMFDFDDVIEYEIPFPEFDLRKEYNHLYAHSKTKAFPVVWYKYKDVDGFPPNEVVFAKEYFVDRFDYWLFTKPELLKDFQYRGAISFGREQELRKYKEAPIFGPNDELKPESKVNFVEVTQEVALYYRDLWAHKLGNTKAEHYFLILIDGKVFGTVGFHTSELFRLKSDKVFENYGFNAPSEKYPYINRLLMYLITSNDMKKVIRATASRVNRVYDLQGLKTTCLSKYRKVKVNNGIMKVTRREKMPDGVYKLMYEVNFYDRTFTDCIKLFLQEHENQTVPEQE